MFIFRIAEDEANKLGARWEVTRKERTDKSNDTTIALKRGDQSFYLTTKWVRDEYVALHGFGLGNCFLHPDWSLELRPATPTFPVAGPFAWELRSCDEAVPATSYPRTLEEAWLRRLIQKKLATEHES